MYVIGHRGSAGTSPENTVAGLRDALCAGAQWIEIDIRCIDGELFVIHDEALDRTTDGSGSIYELSKNEIRDLDAGNGQKVPTLLETLHTIDAKACLNIELKDRQSMPLAYVLVSNLLARNTEWRGKLMFSTFEESIHAELARTLPDGCMLGILLKDLPQNAVEYALGLNAYSLNLSYAQIESKLITQAHAEKLKVFVYTVNDFEHVKTCIDLNIDAIYTDYPQRTLNFLNSLADVKPV